MLLAELKAALKQRIAEGANYAIRQLEEVLRPDSDKFNEFVQIKGRYNAYLNAIVSGMASKAELDGQYNQISTALLYFTDSLREEYLRTEQPAAGPAQTKRGELLYHIPHEMQTAHEYKCAVRVAYLRALLYDDWQRHDDDVQKSIPVAEIMSVELLNQDGSEPFEIRSFSDTIQFLDQDFHTEWAFYVKPRRTGAFPLLLKISVVETRNGRDVKRNIVLEERVVVSTDAPTEVKTNFQKSDIRLDLSGKEQGANSPKQAAEAIAKEGPTVNPSNSNRPLRALAFFLAFLILGSGATWAFTPPSVRDWWVASLHDSVEGYTAYIEKHRDTGPANPRLETAYFRKADKSNSLPDLYLYRDQYPEGKYKQVVMERIARLEGETERSVRHESDGATDTVESYSENSAADKTSGTTPQLPESSSQNNGTESSLPSTSSPTQPASDSDGDGTPDSSDGCPTDKSKIAPGICGCDKSDTDSDSDGIPDCKDQCPTEKGTAANNGCPPTELPKDRESGLTMIPVTGSTFLMGSPISEEGRLSNECHHTVAVRTFSIGQYEVTQADWREIMGSDPPELYNKGCDDCPVERVSWNDVQDFLKKLNTKRPGKNYRLPTEEEWEYASRGGSQSNGYTYAGSNNLSEVAWHSGNYSASNAFGSEKTTHPVGMKKPNELGLYDMSGNVWEWCQDKYGPYRGCAGIESTHRVLRGGGWSSIADICRSATRHDNTPSYRSSPIGFRLASSPQ